MGAQMSDSRKKRMALLDNLAVAKAPPPPGSMMSSNRALRSARDAVDSHHVWELDPWTIEDTRVSDRLDPTDVIDLRDSIEASGQTVPILVRRHPTDDQKYLLVYGRRRLEAIKTSDSVTKVRALVAQMDDDAAMRAQISENMARRDLTFIEKALFARELVEGGYGTQSQIAEVLTVTKSAISMALNVVDTIGTDVVRAIGPAHGIGRPRWEALARAISETRIAPDKLLACAHEAYNAVETSAVVENAGADASVAAFDAVMRLVTPSEPTKARQSSDSSSRPLKLGGKRAGAVQIGPKGLKIEIKDPAFARWLDDTVEDVLTDLHVRWKKQTED